MVNLRVMKISSLDVTLLSSIIALSVIAIVITIPIVNASSYSIYASPSKLTLSPGETATVSIYAVPGVNVSGATLTIIVYDSSIATITKVTPELPNAFIECRKVEIGQKLVMKCALATATPCKGESCKIITLTVKGLASGSTSIVVNGTVGLYSGAVYVVSPITIPVTVKSPVTPPPPVSPQSKCRVVLIPENNVTYINARDVISAVLLNCPQAAGVTLKIVYSGPLVDIVNVIPGDFVKIVGGMFKYVVKNNEIAIAAAGAKACGKTRTTVAKIVIEAKKPGTLTLYGEAQIAYSNGNITYVKIVPITVKVRKYLECDLNMNGKLDIGDVVLLLKAILGKIKPKVPCDLNHNGRIDIGDAYLLLMKIMRQLLGT